MADSDPTVNFMVHGWPDNTTLTFHTRYEIHEVFRDDNGNERRTKLITAFDDPVAALAFVKAKTTELARRAEWHTHPVILPEMDVRGRVVGSASMPLDLTEKMVRALNRSMTNTRYPDEHGD